MRSTGAEPPSGQLRAWPDVLVVTVNLLLANRQPMFLWWGKELTQFYNDAYRPSLGEDKHPRALGQSGPECWPEIWDIIGPDIAAVMSRGDACWYEDQLVPIYRNGVLQDVYWTYSYSPVRSADGTICGTLVTCSETTGRVQLEKQRSHLLAELQHERQRLLELLTQAPAFVAVLKGPEHVFEFTNALYRELIGDRELLGKPVGEAVPEAVEQGYLKILDRVYHTGEPHVAHGSQILLARKAGFPPEPRILDFAYQPVRDSDGNVTGIIALGTDVSDRNKAERLLVQAEKLAVVGRLAASIAHEINNPLEAVTNLLYLVEVTDERAQRMAFLKSAQQELDRVAKITTQTLRFHRESTNKKAVFLQDIVDNVITLLAGRLRNAGLTVEKDFATRGEIVGREGDLRQVFVNLINNAVDACRPGGRIVVRLRDSVDLSSQQKGVRITLCDSGTGMSRPVLQRLFEPFFTTKGMTGTGLGLWISKEILDQHGATLRVRSSTADANHGTVFSMFFPTG
ncbi:two-component system sensor histidine kinase NtrB [Candidatus Korobacter versatilis]|uniref:two-component system sensor histidine kinase NtrB n=1 Tax=Candidatus Korobacter versatilis TaxID=658062 RepID=UPI0011D16301|nr:PAS domain-containing sensor histidine kinase [Candidatus Koribacter versatilis]